MATNQLTETQKASRFLKALGNYYRLQIVQQLAHGELNVSQLNKIVKVSQPGLSQHLSKLRHEGIVAARRQQRQIYYHISNPHVLRVLGVAAEAATQSHDIK